MRRLVQDIVRESMRLAPRKTSDATHKTTSITRIYVAVDTEMPIPVRSATYAATHTGHFGSNANAALGTIQPAISPLRRQRDAGTRAVLSRLDIVFVLIFLPFFAAG